MKIFVTAVGSGKTLNFPHNKSYGGVLAIAEKTENFGLNYRNGKLNQKEIFDEKYLGTKYDFCDLVVVNSGERVLDMGSSIMEKLDSIKKKFSNAKFHLEISAGYKMTGHVLTLISYIRSDIFKLSFLKHDGEQEILPLIEVKMSDDQKRVFRGYVEKCTPGWNGKIASNEYIRNYSKNRKYPYRVVHDAKLMGLVDEKNRPTDFGRLFVKFCC